MDQRIKLLFLGIVFLIFQATGVCAGESKKAAVFFSDAIKPYYQAAQSLETALKNNKIATEFVEVKDLTQVAFESKCRDLVKDGYVYWVSIGPLAMDKIYHYNLPEVAGRVFSMVLAPGKILRQPNISCGVSLMIPVEIQVQELIALFPPDIRPGIIYDPEQNSVFAEQAALMFQKHGIKLNLLKVNSMSDVPKALTMGIKEINFLWMIPDQSVISESIIRYIIKTTMKHGVGVVGYNRFFFKQGAIAAFVINYETIGKQTAGILMDLMNHDTCRSSDPVFNLTINKALIEMLDLTKTP